MKLAYVMVALAATTGCSDGGDDDATDLGPVPGLNQTSDTTLRHGAKQPCGYDVSQDNTWPGSPPAHYAWYGAYTYDRGGNLLSQIDYTDPKSYAYYTYDQLGNNTKLVIGYDTPDDAPTTFLYAYDAFGRLIRSSWDVASDGVEDEVGTYTYDDGSSQPATRSVRYLTDQVNGKPYDKTYYYDGLDRLIGYKIDNGPDGTADLTAEVVYDDRARTRLLTEKDATGSVTQTVLDEFRKSRYLTRELTTDYTVDEVPWYTQYVWEYDGQRSTRDISTEWMGSMTSEPIFNSVTTYQYSHCKK